MKQNGEIRFKLELEKFIFAKLRPYPYFNNTYSDPEDYWSFFDDENSYGKYEYGETCKNTNCFAKLTNHDICHEMFWNAFRDRSKMYIQMHRLTEEYSNFPHEEEYSDFSHDKEAVTLQCSLVTWQMLYYDCMMFNAMNDENDSEYRNAALNYYRPYIFDYVVELTNDKYKELQKLQKKFIIKNNLPWLEESETYPYLWMPCTFDIDKSSQVFDGYVIQSASSINKIRMHLGIIEDDKTQMKEIKRISDSYELRNECILSNDEFIDKIKLNLGSSRLSSVDIYKIGNGNCVFAQDTGSNINFFYDIGFNYRHTPKKLVPGVTYNYSKTMREIDKKNPSFVILSHWDMDHIAGSAVLKKDIFEKDWFAPECYDACLSAKRLAKYLDSKNHLFLAKRCGWGHLIGCLHMPSATYKFYMGQKVNCDKSKANCEGIVIEYKDTIKGKTILMMGDVNYSSFNEARRTNGESLFAYTDIDYLIVPHHGSRHTGYNLITAPLKKIKKESEAVICCTDEPAKGRPNNDHRTELLRRFDNVRTTEADSGVGNSITIVI